MRKLIFVLLLLAGMGAQAQTGYVHADGKYLMDGGGHKLLLRGTNLGNWLVQEGYMFRLEGGPASAREIEALANDLLGPSDAGRTGTGTGRRTSRRRISTL